MPYNILNKRAWLAELEALANTYIDFISKLTAETNEIELDIGLSKKYKSRDLVFAGHEIVDNIQKKLADDIDYIYEFKVIDNQSVVKRKYRVSFDNKQSAILNDLGDSNLVTMEDLKSKYVEATIKITELELIITTKEEQNFALFLDLVEAKGGLYKYASKKKLILMFSRVLKEFELYIDERGTQYSYEDLDKNNKDKVLRTLYSKIYK